MEEKKEATPTENLEERKRSIAREILGGLCLPIRIDNGDVLLYEVTDPNLKEVKLRGKNTAVFEKRLSLDYDSLPDRHKLFRTVAMREGSVTVPINSLNIHQVKEMMEKYIMENNSERAIKPFAWKSDTCFTLRRLNFEPVSGETPAWDEFTNRLSDAGAFKAWVWSIFEEKHKGRQALWVKGREGQDGKSTVMSALTELLGGAYAVLDGSERDNRFVHSNLFDKRLLVYPDCKQPSFVKGQIFRNYSGGDVVSIEFKGMQPFSRQVYSRIMISANYLPTIESEGADTSRLLIVEVGPTTDERRADTSWASKLKTEIPAFLNSCRGAYEGRCKDHYKIQVSDSEGQSVLIQDATSTSEDQWEALLNKYFELDKKSFLPGWKLFSAMSSERLSGTYMGAFKRFLERRGVTSKRLRLGGPDGGQKNYFCGINIKGEKDVKRLLYLEKQPEPTNPE